MRKMDCRTALRLSSHFPRTRPFRYMARLSPDTVSISSQRTFSTASRLPPSSKSACLPSLRQPSSLRRTTIGSSSSSLLFPTARHASNDASTPSSSSPKPTSSTANDFSDLRPQGPPQNVPAPEPNERGEVPAYEVTFTCKPCLTRSTHRISKHGYHNGSVLITCPQCKNRHVMSDHLKIFNETSKSLEEILKEKGQLLKTGVLDPDRDIELWDDGTTVQRGEAQDAREKQGGKE